MRRKMWAVVGALALIVSGCSQGDAEQEYIAEVRDEVPQAREVSDEDLLDYAHAICDALAGGHTLTEIGLAIGFSVSKEEASILGAIGGTGTRHLCPELVGVGEEK